MNYEVALLQMGKQIFLVNLLKAWQPAEKVAQYGAEWQ